MTTTIENKVPLPHILTVPMANNQNLFRFVTDTDLKVGQELTDFNRRQNNPDTNLVESVYNVFKIKEVLEKRKAKGVWDNWPKHPTYYKTIGTFIGCQFECNLGTDKFLK